MSSNISVLESTGEEEYDIYGSNYEVVDEWILSLRHVLTCVNQGTIYPRGDDFRYVEELDDLNF